MTAGVDQARAVLALGLAAAAPGLFVYWFSIHPFIGFWRRFPPRFTLAVHLAAWPLLAAPVILWRRAILAVDFGANLWLALAGAAVLVASARLRRQVSASRFTLRTLVGVAELAGESGPDRLVTEGIYARIRHPRYVQVALAFVGYALLANYLAAYVVAGLTAVWVRLIVLFEERELRQRFGSAYAEYAARVPRFFPARKA